MTVWICLSKQLAIDLYMIGLEDDIEKYQRSHLENFILRVQYLVNPYQNVKIYWMNNINNLCPIRSKYFTHPQIVEACYNLFSNQ